MRIASSLLLIAIGAILIFAIDVSDPTVGDVTVSWTMIGWILAIIGAIGLVLGLIPRGGDRDDTIVREERRDLR